MTTRRIRKFVQFGAEYRSSIPDAARSRVVEKHASGKSKVVEYTLKGEVVGRRCFFETGEPESEYSFRKGMKHGVQYQWYSPGRLTFAEPFANGLPHGKAKQWADDGTLMGDYTMVHGTGIDLWRQHRGDGSVYLSEARYVVKGIVHGFDWWINEDQTTVHIERCFNDQGLHGIWREWNDRGRLRRGFPQYYINNEKVSKRKYMKACEIYPTLPRFCVEDNEPARVFPPEIARSLQP